MKILLDMIPSGRPGTCSSAYKAKTLVEKILLEEKREDVFFYWMYPDWAEDSLEWYTKHPNVKMIKFPYLKDRMREYTRFPDELDKIYAFNGLYWDYDIVVTSRTSMIPMMRAIMSSPRLKRNGRGLKAVLNIEEMHLLSFRPTVALADVEAQEMLTLAGYMASDKVYIQTEADAAGVRLAANQHLSAASQRKVAGHLEKVSPVLFETATLKDPKFRYKKGERPFKLAFTGRLETIASNLERTAEVMEKQFILKGQMMELLVCTVSVASKFTFPKMVEVRRPDRDGFWKACREEMDLMLSLHNNAEFSLSRVEPMLLGVPVILNAQKWATDLFGEDYPYLAKDLAQAYGWVEMFEKDYEGMYAKFAKWQQEVLMPMFKPGGIYGKLMYDVLYGFILGFEAKQKAFVQERYTERFQTNELNKKMWDAIAAKGEGTFFEVLKELSASGELDALADKVDDDDRDSRRIVFSTDWNEYRMQYIHLLGMKDTLETGGFKK